MRLLFCYMFLNLFFECYWLMTIFLIDNLKSNFENNLLCNPSKKIDFYA